MSLAIPDPDHAPRCAYCGQAKPDVMLDRQLDLYLCGLCWLRTYPHTPPRKPKGWRHDDCGDAA